MHETPALLSSLPPGHGAVPHRSTAQWQALDAALSSPSGLGVAVGADGDDKLAGTFTTEYSKFLGSFLSFSNRWVF